MTLSRIDWQFGIEGTDKVRSEVNKMDKNVVFKVCKLGEPMLDTCADTIAMLKPFLQPSVNRKLVRCKVNSTYLRICFYGSEDYTGIWFWVRTMTKLEATKWSKINTFVKKMTMSLLNRRVGKIVCVIWTCFWTNSSWVFKKSFRIWAQTRLFLERGDTSLVSIGLVSDEDVFSAWMSTTFATRHVTSGNFDEKFSSFPPWCWTWFVSLSDNWKDEVAWYLFDSLFYFYPIKE